MQLPLLVGGGCLLVISALGAVIAPAKELWRLGYDAGLRDGLRSSTGSQVVELPPSRNGRDRLQRR